MLTSIKIKSSILWRSFSVPSKSQKGVVYSVEIMKDGKVFCDCIAGQMNRECRHKRIIKHQVSGFTYAR